MKPPGGFSPPNSRDMEPEKVLRAKYLDYCSAQVADILLLLSPDEMYVLAQDAARLEATHGDLDDALKLFSRGIDSFHRAGNVVFLAATLASLAVFFDRVGRHEVAATIYGSSSREASIGLVPHLDDVVEHLQSTLGEDAFNQCVAAGRSQELADAVRYAHEQIDLAS